jgi:hypothetical protein
MNQKRDQGTADQDKAKSDSGKVRTHDSFRESTRSTPIFDNVVSNTLPPPEPPVKDDQGK